MALTTRRRNRPLTGPLPSPKCASEWTTLTTGHSNRLTSRQNHSMPWSLVVNTVQHRWDATSGRVCWRAAPCRWTATGRVSMPTPNVTSRFESASSPTRRMTATQSTPTSGSAAAETPALETGLAGMEVMARGPPKPLVTSWCSSQGDRLRHHGCGIQVSGPTHKGTIALKISRDTRNNMFAVPLALYNYYSIRHQLRSSCAFPLMLKK